MSDTPDPDTPIPTPDDDFGAQLVAEFEKRGMKAPADGDEPPGGWPGGWPGGATADASDISFDIEQAANAVNAETVENADDDGEPDGESVPPSDASEDDPPADPASTADGDDPDAITTTTGTDGEQPAAESETIPSAPAAGYVWEDGDQRHEFKDDEVRRGLMLNQWANSLSDEVRTTFAAIEQGQAVAIGKDDYEQFQAFRAQQERQTRDADLSDLEQIDPDVAKIIQAQRDEIDALKQSIPQQPGQYENLNANLDQTAQQIDQATRTYASQANLPEDQAEQLLGAAVNSGVFRHFSEAQSQRHPMTGAVIGPPNWNAVVKSALDYARSQMQQQPTPNSQQQPAAPAAQNNDPNPPPDPGITAKKARASSVASARSGATPQAPRQAKNLTTADRIQAMADEIAAATSNG